MYGDLGTKLARDGQRILNLPQLPTYAGDLVTSLVREAQALERANDDLLLLLTSSTTDTGTGTGTGSDPADSPGSRPFDPADNPGAACALLVNHLAIRRNKRCLLAYHKVRADRIEAACWAGRDMHGPAGSDGLARVRHPDAAPAALQPADRSDPVPLANLSPDELEYGARFSDLVAAYKGPFTDIDLTGSLVPPGDLFIDVRVLKDAGAVETEYGTIHLTKNSQFFVRHADVEHLLQLGYLQKLG